MNHRSSLCFLLTICCIVLSGCTTVPSDKAKFLGSWEGTYSWASNFSRKVPATLTFYSNGTYLAVLPLIHDVGTWGVANGKLMKTTGNNTVAYTYHFSMNNTTLTLTSTAANDLWNLTKL